MYSLSSLFKKFSTARVDDTSITFYKYKENNFVISLITLQWLQYKQPVSTSPYSCQSSFFPDRTNLPALFINIINAFCIMIYVIHQPDGYQTSYWKWSNSHTSIFFLLDCCSVPIFFADTNLLPMKFITR